jgi:anti-sigma factor RsiW
MTEKRLSITCQELIDFLYLYLEDELPEGRGFEFERHLEACPSCVNYIEQYKETIRLCEGAFADRGAPPPPDTPEELVLAVLEVRRKPL